MKNQPAFGYHQAMHRGIFTLLVGLMLLLGGGGIAIGMPHDDETVCSRATSGAPPVWSSINLLYVEEAVKRGLTCGVGNTTNASLNETTFNQKQILMVNEFIDANKDIFQSSQIVKIQLQGDFKGKKGSYKTTYHGFATANEIFVSSSWGRGFKVIYGSADTKSTTQVLKGWDFVEKPKKDKASVSFKSKTNGSFFEILADGHFSGFKNWSTRVPGKLQLARPINVFLQKRTVSGLRNIVSVQGADSVRREVTRRIKLFRELEKTRKKYELRAKENGVFSPNFGKNNTKIIAQLLGLEEQLKGLSEQFKTQMASLEPVPKKPGVAEVQIAKNVTEGAGSILVNGTTPKLGDLIARNSALLKETEIYSSLLSASLSTSSKSWHETWGVIVMHDQILAFQSHQKGKKFVFGVQHPATPLRLEGYEYYEPNNNMAKISLSGDWTSSFIAAVANRDTFSGHVNWSGKWRQEIELKAASSIPNIKSDPHYNQEISEVIEPEILLKLINARIKKLQRLKKHQRDFEAFLSKKGVLQASVGKDITTKVQELQRFKKNLSDLIQNDVLMAANEKAVGSDDTVNEITTAKPKDERKAKEAEARRLAKLEEQRKAKEAEARRLAKLEEQRKAKEAEARRLAEADKSPPKIFAEVVSQDGYEALIRGVITDDTGLQDMAMNGQLLEVDEQGVFETSVYIPRGGELVVIEALDKMGKLSRFELPLERKQVAKLQLASFEKLSPSNRRAKLNQNAVAVIIGVAEYQRTEVPAVYA
ncbi:MAG: cell envelope integrity protein TolA, partial [Pseudomonadota bacterium]|nr:cell envelope integrity protein TolA [Pseudomonadota bacterium]